MSDQFLVAAVQMVSTDNVQLNLQSAVKGVHQAAQRGAQLVVLPEYFCILSPNEQAKCSIAEEYGCGLIQTTLAGLAIDAKVWLVAGTLPIRSELDGRVFNTQLIFSPAGEVVARYDKIHLFNFSNGAENYDESRTVAPGREPCVVDLPFGRVGLSTCYDLRFPELYRAFGAVDLILVPAAFTETTGQAHWEPLLRARAIENQAYVLAAAQGGEHPGARRTWGHSMLIDPWGEIMTQLSFGEGLIVGEVSRARIDAVRRALPALDNRVM